MLKWRMDDKETAYRIKEAIRDEADILDFISVADAKKIAYTIPTIEEQDEKEGWRWSDLKGNNLMVRTLKDESVWLYICDPTIPISREAVSNDSFEIDILTLLTCLINSVQEMKDGRRKCMIWKKSRKKDVVAEEWPCWFHCWSSNRIVKGDGTVIDQLLAVCEHQDGHVERINYDHIRFVEEWD